MSEYEFERGVIKVGRALLIVIAIALAADIVTDVWSLSIGVCP